MMINFTENVSLKETILIFTKPLKVILYETTIRISNNGLYLTMSIKPSNSAETEFKEKSSNLKKNSRFTYLSTFLD